MAEKSLGVEITELLKRRYPHIGRADAEDVHKITVALGNVMGGFVAIVLAQRGRKAADAVMERFSNVATRCANGTIQKAVIMLAEKPDGKSGEN